LVFFNFQRAKSEDSYDVMLGSEEKIVKNIKIEKELRFDVVRQRLYSFSMKPD